MIDKIELELKPYRQLLVNHSLYKNLKNIDDVKKFMEMHVFAVWDFMSLVKKLQIELTCVQIPWIPNKDSGSARLINEIVWGEETDVDKDGNPLSHFEMYINAMESIKADPSKINNLINSLESNMTLEAAVNNIQIEDAVRDFVKYSFSVIKQNKIHVIAAVFTFGREDLLPDVFIKFLEQLKTKYPDSLEDLVYYFKRHIELDGDEHGPMAINMIKNLCGENQIKWNEVIEASKQALQMRINLWDSISNKITQNP